MARYRKIDSRIWNDKKFRGLSDSGKLVFFMLLTHPHMTSLGAMRASVEGLAAEMGWQAKAFREAFGEASAKGMVEYDPEASFLWLPNFLKYNAPESPNVLKAWVGALDLLPECPMKISAIHGLRDFAEGLTEAFQKAFHEAFAKAMPNPEQEPEPEQEEDSVLANARTVVDSEALPTPASEKSATPKKPNGLDRDIEQQIIAAYHEELPDLPRVRDWTETRHKHLSARVAQAKKRGKPADTVDYWRSVFRKAAASDFLMGRKKDWRCPGLAWLIESPERFAKLIEGGYDNHGR